MFKGKTLVILIALFVLAFVLRVFFLPQNSLTFGYDQARDAFQSTAITHGDLKILGPSASIPGLYHGVFYYYVLAPAYLLGNGNPIVAAYWIAFLNAGAIFIVYVLTFLLTKNKKACLLACLFFAFSFELTQYAVWLSNPTIGVWTVPLIYLGLWVWLKEKNKWGSVITGLGLGLSVQSEIFLLYHAVPVVIWLIMERRNVRLNNLLTLISVFVFAVSTMIIAEIKFGFRSLGGIGQLLSSQDPIGYTKSLGDTLILYLNQLGRVLSYSTYPGNVTYGSILVLILLFSAIYGWHKTRKKSDSYLHWAPFLAVWIFSHSTIVSIGGTSTPFLLVGIAPAVCILLGIAVLKILESEYKFLGLGLIALILIANSMMIFRENPKGQTIFAIQKDMLLSKQLAAIEYTYEGNQQFSINSLTSPLWVNIVWTYLYKWYGQPKYGFIPEFHGRDQIGQIDGLPLTSDNTKSYFLIIEPLGGIPLRYLDETIGAEDVNSKLIEERYFGELRVQKRIRI